MTTEYQKSQIAIDRQRADDARRSGLQNKQQGSRRHPITPMDGTHTVVAMIDAGSPVGPSLLEAARNYVQQWRGAVPPHWRHNSEEWYRRVRLISTAVAS